MPDAFRLFHAMGRDIVFGGLKYRHYFSDVGQPPRKCFVALGCLQVVILHLIIW